MDSPDNQPKKYYQNQQLTQTFKVAWQGIQYAWVHERNLKIHSVCTVLAIGMGLVCQITRGEWGLLMLAIGLVWCMELCNSAIEAVVDLVAGDKQLPLAKVAKDMAAGAVLVAAVIAAIVGAIILLPYII